MASETYCGACGDHAPTILGRCASCWGDRPLETALADMVLLAREAEEVRAENRRLREALEPFAYLDYDIGDEWRDACERARRALAATPDTRNHPTSPLRSPQ